MSHSLPTSRTFLSRLFSSFPRDPLPPSEEPSNPLHSAPSSVKSVLLTLHVLFPNELLPALDLLDRKLVTRLTLGSTSSAEGDVDATGGGGDVDGKARIAFYVRSSQQPRSSRFSSRRTYDALAGSGQNYEVRLKAWNCSCPAFAFASVACLGNAGFDSLTFGDGSDEVGEGAGGGNGKDGGRSEGGGRFGGLVDGEGNMPVCKHLLACLLAECWSGFEGFMEKRVVGKEEMGGWAASWGG
ncbi:MAG: hypothetical protein Q9225_004274 [Loekoesia sp. 1 TL-2023]